MNPIGPEGDIHLQPANMVPLGTKPNPEANSEGIGDDVKGKEVKDKKKDGEKGPVVDHDNDGKLDEKKKAQSTGPEQIAGNGGVVKETKVEVKIDAPPPKPKNLAGLEDTVSISQG
jgi:hypothetical protein